MKVPAAHKNHQKAAHIRHTAHFAVVQQGVTVMACVVQTIITHGQQVFAADVLVKGLLEELVVHGRSYGYGIQHSQIRADQQDPAHPNQGAKLRITLFDVPIDQPCLDEVSDLEKDKSGDPDKRP